MKSVANRWDFERFYQAQIRLYATVDMSPQQIHEIGREQVARYMPDPR